MIEGIQASNYESYSVTSTHTDISKYESEEIPKVFDLQAILKSLSEYTYSEDDLERIDESLISGLKRKFEIEEKDIYNLRKNGYDLERLYIEDMTYYTDLQSTSNTADISSLSSKVMQIGEKIDVIKNQSDNMYLYSLYSNKPVTINSLYQNSYKGSFQKTEVSYTHKDIANVLRMNGLGATKGNVWAASKLTEYGMDVNKHDINKLQNMKSAVESLDKQEELQKAQEDLKSSKEPGERPLIKDGQIQYNLKDIKTIKEELGQIEEADIGKLIVNEEEITIKNLKATLFKNTDLALKSNKAPHFTEGQKQKIQDIKEQIHQVRAKLTTEAAQKISEKMPLESSQLSEIAEELTAIQNEIISQAIKEADLPLTEENEEIIRNVMTVRQEIMENREETTTLELVSDEQIRLHEIHTALAKYGQNETPVEQRFGETIRTVESQIEALLQERGITQTREMVQAAKALITNHMEVNEENLKHTFEIMVKVNTFIEEMTPTKAALLIKEGLNPYQASIDTLLSWISQEQIEQLKMGTAETIVALEEKGKISSSQKEALLGFYRIMQSVNNHREEVVGYLFKNDLSLTIEKLQEATQYIGERGIIEVGVDDSFGEIQALNYMSKTSKMMLEQSSEQISKGIDIVTMLEQMELSITQGNIEKLKKINALLYPIIKEQFKKELGKFEGMETLPKSFLEKLEAVKKVDPKVVSYMLREGIAPTVSNIYWIDKMLKNPDMYKDLLKDGEFLRERKFLGENFPKSFEELDKEVKRQQEEAVKYKESALQKGDILEYRAYKQIQEVLQLQKELSQKDGVYQIPFMVQGEAKMVHLYFNKKKEQQLTKDGSTTAVMTYDTKHLGTITAYINFKEEAISYKVQGETSQITAKLKRDSQFLDGLLSHIGYLVKSGEYEAYIDDEGIDNRPSLIKHGNSEYEEMA